MLAGIDALVFDVQDAGVRFYTYTTTMAYCMEEAAKRKIAFFVLDRPNPLGGEIVEGPMLDADKTSFTAYFPLPVRYGLTIGELAKLFNEENQIHCDLHVIAMKSWRRNYFYEDTGLRWVPPSPNLRTLKGSIRLSRAGNPAEAAVFPWGAGRNRRLKSSARHGCTVRTLRRALNQQNIAGLRFVASGFYSGDPVCMRARDAGEWLFA